MDTPTILVIKESPHLRESICELLDLYGCRTLQAIDGPEGYEVMEADGFWPDLIISDVSDTTLALLDWARAIYPAIPVLLLTATDSVAALQKRYRPVAILCLPFPPKQFLEAVAQLLSGGTSP